MSYFHCFFKSVRTPEGCSLSWVIACNKFKVSASFDKFEEVHSSNSNFSKGHRDFNLNETGTGTIGKCYKVLIEPLCIPDKTGENE